MYTNKHVRIHVNLLLEADAYIGEGGTKGSSDLATLQAHRFNHWTH